MPRHTRSALQVNVAVGTPATSASNSSLAIGLVEIIEGELSGAPVLEVWDQIGHVPAGEVWVAPLVSRVLDGP
jgi:hypothetical protein